MHSVEIVISMKLGFPYCKKNEEKNRWPLYFKPETWVGTFRIYCIFSASDLTSYSVHTYRYERTAMTSTRKDVTRKDFNDSLENEAQFR